MDVQVWVVPLDQPRHVVRELVGVLDADEQRRAAAFYRKRDGKRYTVAHAAVRSIVASRLGREPASLVFAARPGGKPVLVSADLHFSLAHSEGLALVAVADESPVGVDVERIRDRDAGFIAERFFHPEECHALARTEPAARLRRFHALWVCKESCLKQDGRGIGGTLRTVRIDFRSEEAPTARDTAGPWAIGMLELGTDYVGAVAARAPELAVRLRVWSAGGAPRSHIPTSSVLALPRLVSG